jgi:hypothetical protein
MRCVHSGTATGRVRTRSRGMFSPTTGDVIRRGSIDSSFRVLDAIRKGRVAGPLQLKEAVASREVIRLCTNTRVGSRRVVDYRVCALLHRRLPGHESHSRSPVAGKRIRCPSNEATSDRAAGPPRVAPVSASMSSPPFEVLVARDRTPALRRLPEGVN